LLKKCIITLRKAEILEYTSAKAQEAERKISISGALGQGKEIGVFLKIIEKNIKIFIKVTKIFCQFLKNGLKKL